MKLNESVEDDDDDDDDNDDFFDINNYAKTALTSLRDGGRWFTSWQYKIFGPNSNFNLHYYHCKNIDKSFRFWALLGGPSKRSMFQTKRPTPEWKKHVDDVCKVLKAITNLECKYACYLVDTDYPIKVSFEEYYDFENMTKHGSVFIVGPKPFPKGTKKTLSKSNKFIEDECSQTTDTESQCSVW